MYSTSARQRQTLCCRFVERVAPILICMFMASLSAQSAVAASFIPIEVDGPPSSTRNVTAFDVSDDGATVIGRVTNGSMSEAFRWTAATGIVSLDDIAAGAFGMNDARGVSADGSVAVGRGAGGAGPEASIWDATNGTQGLGYLPGAPSPPSEAWAVSADGAIVTGNSNGVNGREAFLWDATNGMQGLGLLSGYDHSSWATDISADGSKVVGYARGALGSNVREAFLWDATNGLQGLGDLEQGDLFSQAFGISADGTTVVGSGTSVLGSEAFVWYADDGMSGLGDLAGGDYDSVANAVSGDGGVVVGRATTDVGSEAFIWDAVNGMQSLAFLLTSLGVDLDGWTLTSASAISPDGRFITGTARNPSGDPVSFLAVIPEPSTALLVGLGMITLAGRRSARDASSRRC